MIHSYRPIDDSTKRAIKGMSQRTILPHKIKPSKRELEWQKQWVSQFLPKGK